MFRALIFIAALLFAAAPAHAGFFFEGDGIPARAASASPRYAGKSCHCGADVSSAARAHGSHHRVRHASVHHHRACVK